MTAQYARIETQRPIVVKASIDPICDPADPSTCDPGLANKLAIRLVGSRIGVVLVAYLFLISCWIIRESHLEFKRATRRILNSYNLREAGLRNRVLATKLRLRCLIGFIWSNHRFVNPVRLRSFREAT